MQDALTPAIGSNQYLMKFDTKAKKRKKIKIKFKHKVITLAIVTFIASLVLNFYLLKAFTVLRCSEGGWVMSKENCNELAQNHFDSQELYRLQSLKVDFNNQ